MRKRYRWMWIYGPGPLDRVVSEKTFRNDLEAIAAGWKAAWAYRSFNPEKLRNAYGKIVEMEVTA